MKALELAYETYGNSSDCPVIILHGFLASSRNWRTVAKRLGESHHVYVLDMRNHGASPHHQRMDYPIMAHDLIEFLNTRGLQTAHLLGHSMGGKVAMCAALSYPERVESLVIADIAPVNYQHSFDPMIQALRRLPLKDLSSRKEAELFLAEAIPDLGFRQFLLQNLLLKEGEYYWRVNLDIIQKTAHHIVGFPDELVQPFADKALFVVGQHSDYVRSESVLKLFPNADIVEIKGAGHWLYVQAPDEFCKVVEDWLTST
ncbi:MAG: alpha/beta fold hydrolase [Gammaproteobacteria bacterium]